MNDLPLNKDAQDQPSTDALDQSAGPALKSLSDSLASALQEGSLGAFEAKSGFAACLLPFLQAIGWKGNILELAQSLPHFANNIDLQDLRNILAKLGYTTLERPTESAAEIDPRLMPCLFVTDDEKIYVLESRQDGDAIVFDGSDGKYHTISISGLKGHAYITQAYDPSKADALQEKEKWLYRVFRRFKPVIWRLIGMTFMLNLLSLVGPFFIMSVYDQVIPSESGTVLLGISVGAVMAMLMDIILRAYRARSIALIGARLEYTLSTGAFAKILSLPSNMTESSPLGNQVARLKDFDSFRELFTSLLFSVVLELPFVFFFLFVIWAFAGTLVLVPMAMILLFAVLWFIMGPQLQRAVRNASVAKADRHGFLVETVSNLRTIKESRAEKTWSERYRNLSAEAATAHKEIVTQSFLFQTLGQMVMTLAGLSTIGFGVLYVIAGDVSVGGLIATMALVWRVLAPIQNLFLTLARASQIKVAVTQVNSLMRMGNEEGQPTASSDSERSWKGSVALQRVSFRYSQLSEPSLLGVSFQARAGEMVAITGPNGAGKSTLLRLILGLYKPQAGQVTLDGMDIRQLPEVELRRAMSYVPQSVRLFHGSIAQNLRLANPIASDEDMREACRIAGILEDVEALDEGFDTRVGDQRVWHLNAGFRQKIAIARAFIKDSPILLLDEPAQNLDDAGDRALIEALKSQKGKRTIIMVTHRPSHIRLADRLVVLNQGSLAAMGAPEAVLKEIPGGLI